ncbi:CG15356 [Drosophila busckii]|uniref:CG15356 n=1 Tax=Drosophila busckii TaxID=30019 RepID=A0A0M4DZH6_DROBS|nr:CG15356 [Drosophila busckii]
MWPQTLEMSRDECRGMLRRLELESYSNIISVFRAQGFLSEPKTKMLEELRQMFHITQERHRAEVRRAANDEQLCTIAENICGPNTWQEWSREGRRPYPLLPRINPQTALTIVANDLAVKLAAENAKLAKPAETGANLKELLKEQARFHALKHGTTKREEPHIIMEEPALKSVAATKVKPMPAARVVYGPPEVLSPTVPRAFASSPVVIKEKLPLAVQTMPQQLPQQPPQQLSTPVKKYIVEERQPVSPANVSTANLPLAPQIISVQQIAAPPRVRTTSATILPPGSKLTPKKINLIDKQQIPIVANAAVRLLPYDHTSEMAPAASAAVSLPAPGISNLSSKLPAAATVQKFIVEERVPNQATTANQSGVATTLSNAPTVNIIKNIPASSLNNTLITPLAGSVTPATGPMFRKACTTTTTATSMAVASGTASTPQIIGNIKLTSGIKHVPSGTFRNIKICSPNGKLFLGSAKLHTGSFITKLNPANVSGGGGAAAVTANAGGVTVSSAALSPTSGGTPTSPQPAQRPITIQKMQLLTPTQVISNAAGGTGITSGATKVKPTRITLATAGVGKNNVVFLPTTGMRAVTLASTKPKPSTELVSAKPNVLVIGPASSANAVSNSQTATTATTAVTSKASKTHQTLITEDTPIDIINMPIIVADNGTTEPKAAAAKPAPVVVLNTTDWEVELDQASKAKGATGATTTKTNVSNSKQQAVEDVIVEEVIEDMEETQQNNRIIEVQEEDGSAIEYVDMELEQPIEIECTSNISPETMAPTNKQATMPDQKIADNLAMATVGALATTLP